MFTVLSFVTGMIFILFYLFKLYNFNLVKMGIVHLNLPGWVILILLLSYVFYFLSKKEEKNPIKYITYFFPKSILALVVFYFLGRFSPYIMLFGIIASAIVILYDIIQIREDDKKFNMYIEGKEIIDDNIVVREPQAGDFVLGQIYKKNLDEDNNIPEGEDEYIPSGKDAVLPLADRFVHVLVLGVTGSGKTSQTLLPMVLQDFVSDDFKYKGIDVVQMGQIVLEPKGDFAKSAWAIGKIKEDEKRMNYISYLLTSEEKINNRIEKLKKHRKRIKDRARPQTLSKEEDKQYNDLISIIKNPVEYKSKTKKERVKIQRDLSNLNTKKSGRKLSKEETDELKLVEESLKKITFVQKNIQKIVPINDYDKLNKLTTHAMFKYASYISDITHVPSEADVTWKQIKAVDPTLERDVFMLFDPSSKDSPYFNPLYGPEDTAVGTVTSTLISFMEDSSEYFKNLSKAAVQRAIRIAKRVHGNDATLIHVDDILTNNGNRGEDMISELLRMDTTPAKQTDNKDITDYFLNTYYPGMKGARGATKDYEQSSGIRNILNNLLDNEQVRHVLNPPKGIGTEIDFDEILKTGDKVALSTSTGASDSVGRMLGSFLILQLQEAIFRRKGKDGQRIPVILYIDEFQDYASSSFEKVLTQGRSYAVSSTMATQTLGIVEQQAGKGLVKNLQSNARNVILYPGQSVDDAKYFVSLFGDVDKKEVNRSISQEVKDDPKGLNKILSQISSDDSGSGGGPRESVSERVTQVERFTESHVIYGPNYKNKGIGGNHSFGFVYYRIVIDNHVQVPSVAKIQYIPEDIKDRSDEIIEAYDAVNEKRNNATSEVLDSGEDLLEQEKRFRKKKRKQKRSTNSIESDPRRQARGKNNTRITEKSAARTKVGHKAVKDISETNRPLKQPKKRQIESDTKEIDDVNNELGATENSIIDELNNDDFIINEDVLPNDLLIDDKPDISEFESMIDEFDIDELDEFI